MAGYHTGFIIICAMISMIEIVKCLDKGIIIHIENM